MDRVILHSDLNNFFASVECLYNPEIRNHPMAVCGDIELRHGIILAKNNLAKAFGIKTGETIASAKNKCPELLFVEPHTDMYLRFSKMAREIYSEYTDQVESFGIDECWLDVTGSTGLYGDGKAIADEVRERMRRELGVTASVGVSYNKVFAKMGSDYKKPDATTVIDRENYRSMLWRLPVNELLFVGSATFRKLKLYNIKSIGDLACADYNFIEQMLGKVGSMLWKFANGLDMSPVSKAGSYQPVKSIGNATTATRDLVCDEDVRITMYVLCESVASRLRADNFRCRTVQLHVRDNKLRVYERQAKLPCPSCLEKDIFDKAFALYKQSHPEGLPIRTLGVRATDLITRENEQLSFFTDEKTIRLESLEYSLDSLKSRYGTKIVQRAVLMTDKALSGFSPHDDHVIHPDKFVR